MTASPREKQVSQLRRQAAHVFAKKAFKHATWVGVFYRPHQGVHPENTRLNIVIFFDPNYSPNKIWDLYADEVDVWMEDPDQPKLERAWDRRVTISRIFEGSLHSWDDVEALFYAETLYGNFNHPVLRQLRFTYYERAKEYQTKLDESFLLVDNLRDAEKQSIGSPEASQQASEIANILKADTVYEPLQHLLGIPRRYAKYLEEMGNNDPLWPETLSTLHSRLFRFRGDVNSLISYANYEKGGGAGRKPA
jgi:hypothetical protein